MTVAGLMVALVFACDATLAISADEPAPVYGQSFLISKVAGTVFARATPTSEVIVIDAPVLLPLGAFVNARGGRVSITTADSTGVTQTGQFWQGRFRLTQTTDAVPFTNLTMLDGAKGCKAKSSAVASKKKRKGGKLWGNAKGHFRTTGAGGSAGTRGTKWFTWEVCRGTYFRVTESTIAVLDFKTKKTFILDTGEAYLART